MATISRELPNPNSSEAPTSPGKTPYEKYRDMRRQLANFFEFARPREVSQGFKRDLFNLALPGIAGLIIAGAIPVGISYFISTDNPQIINMRVEPSPIAVPGGVMIGDGFHAAVQFGSGGLEETSSILENSKEVFTGINDPNGVPQKIRVTKNPVGSTPTQP